MGATHKTDVVPNCPWIFGVICTDADHPGYIQNNSPAKISLLL